MVIDGSLQHGGFVDRLKGIVSFYALAKKHGWRFQIHYTQPFSLGDFFQEGTVKWNCAFIKKTWPAARPIWLFDQARVDLPRLVKRLERGGVYHVYSNIDFLRQIYPDLQVDTFGQFWASLFHELFQISPQIESQLGALLGHAHRVGFHLRFTNLLRDFRDTGKLSISAAHQELIIDRCLAMIREKLADQPGGIPYLFTDSPRFIHEAQLQFSDLIVIPGTPIHTDLMKGPSPGGHEKTILDFVALTRMNHIYFLKADQMYDSKFSLYASYLKNTPLSFVKVDLLGHDVIY